MPENLVDDNFSQGSDTHTPCAPPSSNCADVRRKRGSIAKVRSNFFTLRASKDDSKVELGLLCFVSLAGLPEVSSPSADSSSPPSAGSTWKDQSPCFSLSSTS